MNLLSKYNKNLNLLKKPTSSLSAAEQRKRNLRALRFLGIVSDSTWEKENISSSDSNSDWDACEEEEDYSEEDMGFGLFD